VTHHRCGALRVTDSSLELRTLTDDDRVATVELAIDRDTSHVLRHLLAAHLDPASDRRRRARGRSLLERSLAAAGGALDRVEVLPGEPPRFVLVLATPTGCLRRIDLDLLEVVELAASRRVPLVAVGWPERDWDGALGALLRREHERPQAPDGQE
jgi:hypothetical protein